MDSPLSWRDEARAVIKDVEAFVKAIAVSDVLQSDERSIYLNVITNENKPYCIELSASGFRVVGVTHDSTSLQSDQYYDTPYSLLSEISESYTNTFASALISKLQDMKDDS